MGNEYEKLEKRLAAIVDKAMRRNLIDNGTGVDRKFAYRDALAAVKRDYELLTFHIGHAIERAMRDWDARHEGKVVPPIYHAPKTVRVNVGAARQGQRRPTEASAPEKLVAQPGAGEACPQQSRPQPDH